MLNRNYLCARAHHGNEILFFYFDFSFFFALNAMAILNKDIVLGLLNSFALSLNGFYSILFFTSSFSHYGPTDHWMLKNDEQEKNVSREFIDNHEFEL